MDHGEGEDDRPPCKPLDVMLLFLGTASMRPSLTRNVSGNAIRIGSEWIIVDCGEGTQHQIVNSGKQKGGIRLSPGSISRIFITHLHGDHCFGLPGLLCLIDNNSHLSPCDNDDPEVTKIVHIVGPKGLRNMLRATLGLSATRFSFRIRIDELVNAQNCNVPTTTFSHFSGVLQVPAHSCEIPGEDINAKLDGTWSIPSHPGGGPVANSWTMSAAPLRHTIESVGYVFHEHPHQGKLDPSLISSIKDELMTQENRDYQLNTRGIHNPIQLLGNLQRGETVTIMTSNKRLRTLEPKDYMTCNSPGRKLVLLGDTCDSRQIASLAANADVLVHEATNAAIEESESHQQVLSIAISRGHSTPSMAGTFAKCCGAKTLILTHFSSRYKGDDSKESVQVMNKIVKEAQNCMGRGNVVAARDFMHMTVPIKQSERDSGIDHVSPARAAKDAAETGEAYLRQARVV